MPTDEASVYCRSIKEISLSHTKMTTEGLNDLRKRRPRVKIEPNSLPN